MGFLGGDVKKLKVAAAAIAAFGLAGLADAATAAPVFNWTGFYVGAYAGYAWGRTVGTDDGDSAGTPWYAPLGQQFSSHNDSFIGGGQAGYNYQFGQWVAGVEGDLGSMRFQGTFLYGGDTPLASNSSYDATLRARFGYAFDRSLVYVTGGAFGANFRSTVSRPATGMFSTDTGTQWGWTVGGGWEYGFTPNWSVKAEYLHFDAGTKSIITNQCGCVFSINNSGDLVRLGVNYRFLGQ